MIEMVLRLLIAASALTHFISLYYGWQPGIYVTKPLTMLLIIVLCLLALSRGHEIRYTRFILTGLVFSLAGDVFLMLPSASFFLPGLFAFLVAHVFYVAALWQDGHCRRGDYLSGGILLAAGLAILLYLQPHLDAVLIGPVILYIAVISLMAWRAIGTKFRDFLQPHQQNLVIIGALLFYLSDLFLAINRFAHPLPLSGLLVMVPYFTAQYFLASSVYRTDRG